jgi:hypothetical protein
VRPLSSPAPFRCSPRSTGPNGTRLASLEELEHENALARELIDAKAACVARHRERAECLWWARLAQPAAQGAYRPVSSFTSADAPSAVFLRSPATEADLLKPRPRAEARAIPAPAMADDGDGSGGAVLVLVHADEVRGEEGS